MRKNPDCAVVKEGAESPLPITIAESDFNDHDPEKSPVALLVAAVFVLSACSSSSNSDNDVLEDGQTPSTPADTNGDNLTTDSNGSDTDPVTGVVDKPGVADALPLDQLHDQLIIALAAYPVENLSDEVVLLETIAVGAAPGTRLADGAFSVIVRDQDVVTLRRRRNTIVLWAEP